LPQVYTPYQPPNKGNVQQNVQPIGEYPVADLKKDIHIEVPKRVDEPKIENTIEGKISEGIAKAQIIQNKEISKKKEEIELAGKDAPSKQEIKKEENPKNIMSDLLLNDTAIKMVSVVKNEVPKKAKKLTYTKEYLLSFRETCKARPFHMKDINVPLIKWKPPVNEDIRVKTIKEVRNLLNKFAKSNYKEYTKLILSMTYTGEVLMEVAKILFNKAVKEASYVEFYMELCDQLMKKFKSTELNFRKMFITKCQSIFEENKDNEYDQVLKDVDEDERRSKNRMRLFGNMKLIGELFIRGALNDQVLLQCFTKLFNDKTEEAIENLCHLVNKVGKAVYYYFAYTQGQTSLKKKSMLKIKSLTKDAFDEYIDKLIDMKSDPKLSTRVKFMLQDVIDARETDWMAVFDEFVVKENNTNKIVFHVKEKPKIEKKEEVKTEVVVDDPKVAQRELRKSSLNETSILGVGLDIYANVKLDEITRV